MPIMTQATHNQIEVNKQNITSLNTPKGHIKIESHVPTLTLGMESGGPKRADIIFKDDETDTIRGMIQYVQNGALGSELIFETRDENNNLQNVLLMGANGHIINPTSGETITSENDLVTAKMLTEPFRLKADLNYVDSAVINEFSGTVPPSLQTGKSNDIFHQYPTQVDTTIQSGTAIHDYNVSYFPLYQNQNAPNGIIEISVSPNNREIALAFTKDNKPQTTDYILEIDGSEIPLQVIFNTASGYVGYYSQVHDGKIQSITSGIPFRLRGMILNGARTDWIKSGGVWFLRPIFNNTYDYVKTGIPSGASIVIQTLSYSNIARLTTTIRDAGIYQITFSLTFDYDSTKKSAKFRWSIDGGITWEEFSVEPKDKSDKKAMSYIFPTDHTGGIFDLILDGACESSGNTLTIDYANIIVERKA